ncbi:hypothetical protein [Campylobacter canadensis]|uniref:hypothetical protein n=1 Tax=Campylobacter canadensis TaxID=449520 RepID=UPI001CCA712F|nr:hypothetical protein [Campylobacter canadensis]MBZ8002369.1 hypothetical protein [Campylobacter canadensis]
MAKMLLVKEGIEKFKQKMDKIKDVDKKVNNGINAIMTIASAGTINYDDKSNEVKKMKEDANQDNKNNNPQPKNNTPTAPKPTATKMKM